MKKNLKLGLILSLIIYFTVVFLCFTNKLKKEVLFKTNNLGEYKVEEDKLTMTDDEINFFKNNDPRKSLKGEKNLILSKINLEGDMKELTITLDKGIDKIFIVSNEKKEIGYAIEASEFGINKDKEIKFAVGISTGGIITGVQIIDHKETNLIEDENFLNSFIGVSSLDKLSIKESKQEIDLRSYGEVINVDLINGATESSMTIIKGITNVINFYNNNLS